MKIALMLLLTMLGSTKVFAWCQWDQYSFPDDVKCVCDGSTPAKALKDKDRDGVVVKIIDQKKNKKGTVMSVTISTELTGFFKGLSIVHYFQTENGCKAGLKKAIQEDKQAKKLEEKRQKEALKAYE